MKKSAKLTFFMCLTLLAFTPHAVWAADGFQDWDPNVGYDVEFGITSLVSGSGENAPWIFENGYNGALWFDKDYTAGQTFTVDSDRLLQSVTTRVNAWNDATGQFEMALYEFDQASQSTTNRLAFITGDAASYRYDLSSVPMSTFDLSGFNVTLAAGQSYMLTFRGKESSEGHFSVQGGSNIYGGGGAYLGTYAASGPDLTATWMMQGTGRKIKGNLFVENIGTEPVAEFFTIDVYLSDDGSTPGKLLHSRKISARDKHRYIITDQTHKINFPAFADHYVIAVIDSGNRISEINEDNNIIVLQSPATR